MNLLIQKKKNQLEHYNNETFVEEQQKQQQEQQPQQPQQPQRDREEIPVSNQQPGEETPTGLIDDTYASF